MRRCNGFHSPCLEAISVEDCWVIASRMLFIIIDCNLSFIATLDEVGCHINNIDSNEVRYTFVHGDWSSTEYWFDSGHNHELNLCTL